MHKIGVISDTHGLLRPEVIKALQGCEAILHAGDFDRKEIMDALKALAPVHAVLGNNDEWAAEYLSPTDGTNLQTLPETLSLELYGVRIFMTHNKRDIPKDTTAFDLVIYGHSHKYEELRTGSQLRLNPGSCGPRRFTLPVTLAILEIAENGTFHVERIDLEEKTAGGRKGKKSPDIKKITELVVRDTRKGIPVRKIADRHHISPELAEQICRLYLTHPGIDAEGILRKMGL